jgi:hypothetical protein
MSEDPWPSTHVEDRTATWKLCVHALWTVDLPTRVINWGLAICGGSQNISVLKCFLFATGFLRERGERKEGVSYSLLLILLFNILGFNMVPDPSLPLSLLSPSPELVCFNFFS